MTDDRVYVCDADELDSGDRTVITVGDEEVGVFHVDDAWYAVVNQCPHRGGPVCEGKVTNALEGTWPGIGRRLEERMSGAPAIACPWHGWEFDLDSGHHLGDETFRVRTYDVIVNDGEVFVASK